MDKVEMYKKEMDLSGNENSMFSSMSLRLLSVSEKLVSGEKRIIGKSSSELHKMRYHGTMKYY